MEELLRLNDVTEIEGRLIAIEKEFKKKAKNALLEQERQRLLP